METSSLIDTINRKIDLIGNDQSRSKAKLLISEYTDARKVNLLLAEHKQVSIQLFKEAVIGEAKFKSFANARTLFEKMLQEFKVLKERESLGQQDFEAMRNSFTAMIRYANNAKESQLYFDMMKSEFADLMSHYAYTCLMFNHIVRKDGNPDVPEKLFQEAKKLYPLSSLKVMKSVMNIPRNPHQSNNKNKVRLTKQSLKELGSYESKRNRGDDQLSVSTSVMSTERTHRIDFELSATAKQRMSEREITIQDIQNSLRWGIKSLHKYCSVLLSNNDEHIVAFKPLGSEAKKSRVLIVQVYQSINNGDNSSSLLDSAMTASLYGNFEDGFAFAQKLKEMPADSATRSELNDLYSVLLSLAPTYERLDTLLDDVIAYDLELNPELFFV